jgi:hypothetical protein
MTRNQSKPPRDAARRYDVDWLRVLGMMVVFLFHCSRFFDTEGWLVKSPITSEAATQVTVFVVQWMMPLFFILSGIGIYHALCHQTWRGYLVARIKRLLIPLLFGIFVIIAPLQVYLERISYHQFTGSFWSFYIHYFEGWYGFSGGNFAWMGLHLWYLLFLFVFSLLTLPMFMYLRTDTGRWIVQLLTRFFDKPWHIFLWAIPIATAEFIACLPPIRGTIFGHEAFGGWSTLPYLTMLIIGYLLAAGRDAGRAMERHRVPALLAGILIIHPGKNGARYH